MNYHGAVNDTESQIRNAEGLRNSVPQWEKISDTSERLRVDGGYLYKTWTLQLHHQHHFGFVLFDSTSQWYTKENVQTVFVPDAKA